MLYFFEGDDYITNINTLERLIEAANQKISRIYLAYDENETGTENLWKSPIINGSVSMMESTQIAMKEKKSVMNLRIVREPWWEENVDRDLFTGDVVSGSLTNKTNITNGTVIEIDGDDIKGTFPTPINIEIKKTTSGELSAGTFLQIFQDKRIVDRGVNTDTYTITV